MSGTNALAAGQWPNIANLGAGTLASGNTGLNGSYGGQAASNARPLRGPPVTSVRQPYLGQAPFANAATGFGTGSGVMVRNQGSDADQSQGLFAVKVGLAPAGTGTIVANFPAAIPAGGIVFLADWCTIAASIVGGVATLTWTATRTLVTGEMLLVAYQWAVST